METGKKFRNHISVVAEEVWGSILALFILVFVQGLPELAETSADDLSFLADKGLWIALGLTVILAVLIGNRLLVWARTYIYLEDNAIVIEKNTVNKKKNTIGIKSISNINLERNLFEMLVGTCKVKLDTNSLSTADKTDVKIVLKKADAERFRREVTARMHASGSVELSAGETDGISGNRGQPGGIPGGRPRRTGLLFRRLMMSVWTSAISSGTACFRLIYFPCFFCWPASGRL